MAASSFAGAWFTSFGRLELVEAGCAITGAYQHKGGRVEGTRDGARFTGRWREGDRDGPVELTLEPGGNTFDGGWSYDGEEGLHGRWTGVRLTLPAPEDGGSPGASNSPDAGPVLSGPMVGEVGQTDAFVWAQARDGAPITLVVRGPGGEVRVEAEPAWDAWLCVTFHVEGLEPGTEYAYTIESALGATPAQRFRTAPGDGARRARIAFGSCFRDHDAPAPIFDSIRRAAPDLFLMVGDNCYYYEPDWQTQHTMMLAQLRSRNGGGLGRLLAEVPVLGIWDDHDFGPNDSDGSFAGREDSLAVFRRVWAQRAFGEGGVPGIFSSVRFGPVELFLLDGRYYRERGRAILGEAQLGWLCGALLKSDAPVKLLVSGSQVLPEAAVKLDWECWRRDAPGELERLLSFVEERDVRGVVLVSGDVHLGYLLYAEGRALAGGRRGPDLWELTASPLANDPWTETVVASGIADRYLRTEHAACNYGVIDVDLDREGAEVRLTLDDASGRPLVTQAIALASLRVRDDASA